MSKDSMWRRILKTFCFSRWIKQGLIESLNRSHIERASLLHYVDLRTCSSKLQKHSQSQRVMSLQRSLFFQTKLRLINMVSWDENERHAAVTVRLRRSRLKSKFFGLGYHIWLLGPCLVHSENQKFFNILHHIESCSTCMKH